MNCLNHPEIPVAAFCQNCGKPLCQQCVRSISGLIYCEQCLAARLGVAAAPGPGAVPPVAPFLSTSGPNPALATLLGFLPGVGAMYNGQFLKAIVHVVIFVVLVGITEEHGIFGIFIGAWVLYQVFDAHQTAKARRDDLPLPDPFGLNDLGIRFGINIGKPSAGPGDPAAYQPPYDPSAPPPPPGPGGPPPPAQGFHPGYGQGYGQGWGEGIGPASGFAPGYADPSAPPPPEGVVPPPEPRFHPAPAGAIVLIGLGVLFLFSSLDIWHFNWIWRGWPFLVIGVGIWQLLVHLRNFPRGGGQ